MGILKNRCLFEFINKHVGEMEPVKSSGGEGCHRGWPGRKRAPEPRGYLRNVARGDIYLSSTQRCRSDRSIAATLPQKLTGNKKG